MKKTLDNCVNPKNPTAREAFLSDRKNWSEQDAQQLEDSFFFLLRLPNGTKKTTYKNRLDDVAKACNRLLADRHGPLKLMDLAISSGVTTKEWIRTLDALNIPYQMDATDLCLYGTIESPGKNFHVLRDSNGHPLQFEIYGWALANHLGYGFLSGLKRLLPVVSARLGFAGLSAMRRKRVESSRQRVLLVTRELEQSDRLKLYEADLFDIGSLSRKFDMIRAANILNFAYFNEMQLKAILQQLLLCLEVDSYLVVVRSREDRSQNDGTVFVKNAAGNLSVVERFGEGSEIEPVVARLDA